MTTSVEKVTDAEGNLVSLVSVRVNATSDGANALLAATAAKVIAVYALAITPTAAGAIEFRDTDDTPVHAGFDGADGIPIVLPFTGIPWFTTSEENVGLELLTQTGQDVLGVMIYALR